MCVPFRSWPDLTAEGEIGAVVSCDSTTRYSHIPTPDLAGTPMPLAQSPSRFYYHRHFHTSVELFDGCTEVPSIQWRSLRSTGYLTLGAGAWPPLLLPPVGRGRNTLGRPSWQVGAGEVGIRCSGERKGEREHSGENSEYNRLAVPCLIHGMGLFSDGAVLVWLPSAVIGLLLGLDDVECVKLTVTGAVRGTVCSDWKWVT